MGWARRYRYLLWLVKFQNPAIKHPQLKAYSIIFKVWLLRLSAVSWRLAHIIH